MKYLGQKAMITCPYASREGDRRERMKVGDEGRQKKAENKKEW